MQYKSNYSYFHKSKKPLIIGAILAVIGFVFYYFRIIWYLWAVNFFTVVMVVGLLMVIFFFVSSVKDKELDNSAATYISGLENEAKEKIVSLERTPRILDTYIGESYVYDSEDSKEFKKGLDGTFRSDIYSASCFVVCQKKLYVMTKTFSLVDESYQKSEFMSFPYENITSVTLKDGSVEKEYGKKTYSVSFSWFSVNADGKEYVYPTHNDSLADDIISKIYLRKSKVEEQ